MGGKFDGNLTDITKLITVVLNVGLEPGFRRDGLSKEGVEGQVLDCLNIIQSAIEKVPQALSENSDPGVFGGGVCAPLYACLTARLFGLYGSWDSESVRTRVCLVLSSMVYSQLKQVHPWPHSVSVPTFLHACTADILESLEHVGIPELRQFRPSAASAALSVDINFPDLPSGSFEWRVTFGTLSQAFSLVLGLLGIFIPSLTADLNAMAADPFVRQNRAWAYNGYQRVWNVIFYWLNNIADLNMQHHVTQICVQFLATLRAHCNREVSLPSVLPSKLDFTYLWLQSLADLLALENLVKMPTLERELGQFLYDIPNEYSEISEVVPCVESVLVPALIDVASNSVFQALEPYLQVIIMLDQP